MKKLLCCVAALALLGCSEGMHMSKSVGAPVEAETRMVGGVPAAGQRAGRHIALRHSLVFEAPGEELQKRFDAIHSECLKLGCIVLNAKQTIATADQYGKASLSARIPPAAFSTFLKGVQAQGKLLQHNQDSDDKTAEVIDVEAKIKNLTALRDRITELLAKRTGKLEEVLAAERQLAETQSQLDSIQMMRKALAAETELVRVDIELLAERLASKGSWAEPTVNALGESGRVLMSSLGAMITFVVAALPWLLLFSVPFFLIRRMWRNRKKKPS
ncbi:MAG: DUF4349 domain-containing protein [Pseudomonadota bacterium]